MKISFYTLPKPSSFEQPYKEELEQFSNHFTQSDAIFTEGFPQNPKVLRAMRIVPPEFKLIDAGKILRGEGELYKWTYCIPATFYKGLHKQIKWFAGLSFLLFFLLCFIPGWSPVFACIGAPALICFAFACYTGMYMGLLYLDKSVLKSWKISIRFLLVIILVLSSIYNQDHPVRMSSQAPPERNQVVDQFDHWFKTYKNDIDFQDNANVQAKKYPVVFICAEGGALRTGAYTSLFLTSLEDKLESKYKLDFRKSVFAMSGVSGGAVGLGLYNALSFESEEHITPKDAMKMTSAFFQHDSLSPIIGKMLFGDFLNLFLPWHFDLFDRSVALEESWEESYQKLISKKQQNIFSRRFINEKPNPKNPLFIINTTEIETGLPCWVSNLAPDSLALKDQRDLFKRKLKNLNYSTAINFSTRFPLFSPAAKVGGEKNSPKLHYLDGGYVENTGSASMLEVLELLKRKSQCFDQITPIVITLLFSEEDNSNPNINFGNELTEIFNGLYNPRSGRSKISRLQIKQFVQANNNGFAIDAPLTAKEKNVPMNWVLSAQSMNNISQDVHHKLANETPEGILARLLREDLTYIKIR